MNGKQTNDMKRILTTILLSMPLLAFGQRIEKVHGQSTYEVTDNTRITLYEAKKHAIEQAQADGIKKVFGERVTSDMEIVNEERNGKVLSRFRETTRSVANGQWLGNEKDPVIHMEYDNGILYINADVWGTVREFSQSEVDLRWHVAVDSEDGQRVMTSQLLHKQPFYVHFQSSVNGYLAIYVLDQSGEASCLLPKENGMYHITGGKSYRLFDKKEDSFATPCWFTEDYQIVLLFSPKSFSKCIDEKATDYNKFNTVKAKYFESWLKRIQLEDPSMVVKQLPLAVYKEEY